MEACGCVITSQDERKVVERCGKFEDVLDAGFSCVLPCLCQFVKGSISTRIQMLEINAETKTKDNVFVGIKVAVQYQVNGDSQSIQDAMYKLTNPRAQIESYVLDVVRSSVPKIDLDNVFLEKEEIAASIKEMLGETMGRFGYSILATPVTDIEPNLEVKRAMNEINKAKRLRQAAVDEGEAIKIRSIKEAEAEAARTEIQAKADAEAKFMQGQGIARQRQAIVSGLRDSVNCFKADVVGVDSKQVMDLLLVTQYFDMMKDIGGNSRSNAVFMNHSPGALQDLTQAIQGGFMSSLPAAPSFAQAQRH